MEEVSLVNFAIVFALVPIVQALTNMLKHDSMGDYGKRALSIVLGLGLTFLVRQAGAVGFSESLSNPYLAGLTGLVVALIAGGFYEQQKAGIVKKIAESEDEMNVKAEMVGIEDKDVKKKK